MIEYILFFTIFLFAAVQVESTTSYDSNFDLERAKRFVRLAGASYCTDPLIGKDSINNWSCQACKNFPNVNATTFHGKITDANGFVGYDHDINEIIIAFAGTDPLSIQNWIDDLNFFQTDFPYCAGCRVHEGFYKSFLSVIDQIRPLLSTYISSYPTASLTITGHSLGAALAAHCAAELSRNYSISTVYTYGMPRVGNEAFEIWYKSQPSALSGTFRVVHDHDPVPHLPLENMGGGFHHMPYEVFYTYDYKKWTLCDFEGEDKKCSDKFLQDLDILNHLNYLDFDFTTNYVSCEI